MSHVVPPRKGVFWVIAGKLHAFPFSPEYPLCSEKLTC